MSAILENESLPCIDIFGNRVGNSVLELLQSVFDNHPKITEALFEQNAVINLDALPRLYNSVGQIDRRILVRFPGDDLEHLRANEKIADGDIPRLRMQCADALRRKMKRREQVTADDDPAKKAQLIKPGEFLEALVSGKVADGVFPEGVKELVDQQNAQWIGDEEWLNAAANGFRLKENDDPVVGIAQKLDIAALFSEII
jgi:hypothetical protein